MRVRELMTEKITTCTLDSSLAGVASRMWLGACGAVPVLDETSGVVGIVTDRDVCMAVAAKDRPASEIRVREVMSWTLYTCSPDDDVHDALHTMRDRHVRRLPVVDHRGRLVGMLSLTDAILHAGLPALTPELPYEEVMDALQSVSRPTARVADEALQHA